MLRVVDRLRRAMPATTGDIVSKSLPADGVQPYTCATARRAG